MLASFIVAVFDLFFFFFSFIYLLKKTKHARRRLARMVTHLCRSPSGHLRRTPPTFFFFFFSGFRTALAGVHWPGLVVSPTGGILSGPPNFNFVCSRWVAAGAEELKPRLNTRNERPANRLRVGRRAGGGGGGGGVEGWGWGAEDGLFSWIRDLIHRRVKTASKEWRHVQNNGNNRYERVYILISNRCFTLFKGGIKSENKYLCKSAPTFTFGRRAGGWSRELPERKSSGPV